MKFTVLKPLALMVLTLFCRKCWLIRGKNICLAIKGFLKDGHLLKELIKYT